MKPELLLSVDSKQSFWIDPRTKLYMLVIFSIVMIDGKTDGISFWLKPILALIPFFLLLSGRRKKIAIIYLIVFIVSWTVNVFLVPYMGLIGTIIISLLAQFGTRWFPSAMMGYYLLSTTKVSEFVLAMQRMHIPEAFIIPFSVMFRFFPTISEEAGSIGNAMRMRGITGKNFFKNPQAVLEYRIVPLMMSVVTIGNVDDWTIARLLGHRSLRNVKYYRKMSNKILADDTRKTRNRLSKMVLECLEGWEEEYEQIRFDDSLQ